MEGKIGKFGVEGESAIDLKIRDQLTSFDQSALTSALSPPNC